MHIIYITGLGDQEAVWQRRAVRLWRLYGVKPYFFQVRWADGEPFSQKLKRLEDLVTKLQRNSGQQVGIVAVSAGASLGLHILVKRSEAIAGVVTICGKLLHPEAVMKSITQENPAFAESMSLMPETLSKCTPEILGKLLCVSPLADRVVSLHDQYIEGAHRRRAYSFGHAFTIGAQLVFGIRRNANFLKQQASLR